MPAFDSAIIFTFRGLSLVPQSRFAIMASHDLRRLARDRFLVGCLAYVVVLAWAFRWGIPWAALELKGRFDFGLVSYYPLITSYVTVMLGGMLAGVVGGFLLLETREDRTLSAVLVSPLPLKRFLVLEAGLTYIVAVPVVVLSAVVIGHGLPPWPALLACALVGGLIGPAVTLFVAAVADDKVHAFAIMKLIGLMAFAPVAAWFVPEPWQWCALALPPYGVLKAWWVAEAGGRGWVMWLFVGGGTSMGMLVAAAWRFLRVARRS